MAKGRSGGRQQGGGGANRAASQDPADGQPRDPDGKFAGDGAAGLDKVRDILFGEQTRRSEARFGELEARLDRERQAAEQKTAEGLTSLGDELKRGLADAAAALKDLAGEQGDARKAVEAELSGRLAELEASLNATEQTLRDERDAQHEALRADLRALGDEQTKALESLADDLGSKLVSRAELSRMFAGMADALAGE